MTDNRTMSLGMKRAIVVADWERCSRGLLWTDELDTLGVEHIEIRLADSLISETRKDPTSLVQALESRDVLILNFDCINGDPAFGSNIALEWFSHRNPELLQWVADGGTLIVEGQAMLAVPTQASYDALFGFRELLVSGPSARPIPGLEMERTGGECRVTTQASKFGFFPGSRELRCTTNRSIDDFFPRQARLMLSAANVNYNWKMLYRGWFPQVPNFGRRFHWVPLIKTERKKFGFDHTILLAARYGSGIMFVSTMWLAGTGNTQIIRSLLEWNSKTSQFPTSEPREHKIVEKGVAAAMSAVAAVITPWILKSRFAGIGGVQPLVVFLLWIAYWVVLWLGRSAWKRAIDLIGL